MISVLYLLACGGGAEQVPAKPEIDLEVSAKLAEAWCKLHQGARLKCGADGATAVSDGRKTELQAWVLEESEQLGVSTMNVRIELILDGVAQTTLSTPMRAYGGGRTEAIERGIHEWAVVYGVALVDFTLADDERPAVKALLKPDQLGAPKVIEGRPAYRGFSLVRGTQMPLDMATYLGTLTPTIGSLDPATAHGLSIDLTRDPGNPTMKCVIDGLNSPKLCAAVEGYAWPGGAGTEIRQYVVIGPKEMSKPAAQDAPPAAP